jgi:hypothetical protein
VRGAGADAEAERNTMLAKTNEANLAPAKMLMSFKGIGTEY